MFNKASSQWAPYVIPEAPNVASGEKYFLRLSNNATSGTNPSKFLQWEEVEANLPEGQNLGDLLYWDPEAGEEGGAWVVLNAPTEQGSIMYWDGEVWQFIQPPSSSTLHVLTVQDSNLSWTATEDCP